jgi:hypothetical protein
LNRMATSMARHQSMPSFAHGTHLGYCGKGKRV